MSQNPYRPSVAPSSSSKSLRSISAARLGSIVGSIVLFALGIAVGGLGLLPSDASGFFLLNGAHLIACGTLGVTCARAVAREGVRSLLGWTLLIVNAVLVVRIAIFIFDGTVRGPLILAAPLLLGLPAALNVASAALSLRRRKTQIA